MSLAAVSRLNTVDHAQAAEIAKRLGTEDMEQARLMAEQCLLIDENDNVIGSVSKEQCHYNSNIQKGMLHRAFSVFLFNSKGQLLLQQRAHSKITFAGMWTNTCCSHPLNTPEEREENHYLGVKRAALRKLDHELGIREGSLSLDDLKFITRIHYKAESNGLWGEHEVDHILFVQKDVEFKINENEVAECKYVNKEQLQKMFEDKSKNFLTITPWFHMICDRFIYGWWDNLAKIARAKDGHDPSIVNVIHRLRLPADE